jgi:alpha-beta hydrolase superfamily lysophospholipase
LHQRPPRRLSRLRLKLVALAAAIALGIWLLSSLTVAYALTRRQRPPFAEPVPAVSWGPIEGHRLRTGDGQEVGAWFAPGEDERPSVVLLHGNGGSRGGVLDRAEMLAGLGCSLMMVTLRAHGDSSGEWNDFGLCARHDVVAAVEFLERRRPGRPIVIMGCSLGSAAAVFASAELGHRVRGYILECPYQDLKVAVRNRTRNYLPRPLDRVAYQGLLAVSPIVLPRLEEISPLEAMGGIPADVPVLILAGGRDRQAHPDEARALLGRVSSHGRLVVFEGASHMQLHRDDPARFRRSVLDFLDEIDGPE